MMYYGNQPSNGTVGFRNRLINGSMRIDQRNNGASVSSGTNALTYTLDRWVVATGGAAVTVQRLGNPGSYYMQVTGAAGVTACNIRHRIESANIADLAGLPVTVSFLCSSTSLASITVALGYASAADNFGTVTNISAPVQAITSSGTTYSVTFTLPSGAANGVELEFVLGAFTSGTFALTNVQLEAGSVATPFERRPYGLELALCQRYYAPVQAGSGAFYTSTGVQMYGKLPLMRVSPSVSLISGTSLSFTIPGVGTSSIASPSFQAIGIQTVSITGTSSTSSVDGNPAWFGDGLVQASAEL